MNSTQTIIALLVALAIGCALGWAISQPGGAEGSSSGDLQSLRDQVKDLNTRLAEQANKIDALHSKHEQLGQRLALLPDDDWEGQLAAMENSLKDDLRAVLRGMQASEEKRFGDMLRGGTMLREAGFPQQALIEFCKTIAVFPDNYAGYANRGMAYQDLGQWDRALEDFETSARLNPSNIVPWNNLAWLKATCPDAKFRSGSQAVELATKTCEMSEWKNFATISTLAAAYAEAGEFAAAIKWQQRSIELAPEVIRPKLAESLALFEAEKPIRETAKRPPAPPAKIE